VALSLRDVADGSTPPLRRTACKFTISYKKARNCPALVVQTRRDHCERFVARAGASFSALATRGRVHLFTASVEVAESAKGDRNFHVQGFTLFSCHGDDALACEMLKGLFFALDYHETGVQTNVYVVALTPDELDNMEHVGMMFAYTLKDKSKDTYSNVQGGTDWSEEQTREWVRKMKDRNANVNSTGFVKSSFSMANRGDTVKVDSMNLIPLVIAYTRRNGFDRFQASFLRRLSWMLMSCNYELDLAQHGRRAFCQRLQHAPARGACADQ
jgi:hypothetical protein